VAEVQTGNEFLDKLLGETAPQASQPRRGQNYNYPYRLYLKPDGTVVQLQGDPNNRALYQDKGYRLLSETPSRSGKSEADTYRQDEYPTILKEQRDKAALINAIRRAAERDPGLNLETTFDDYSVIELRDYLKQIKDETGREIRVILPKRAAAREAARDAQLLSGVETNATASLEEVQAKVNATFEGQTYDPIEQARKRRQRDAQGSPA
jgi:hypothetical protein